MLIRSGIELGNLTDTGHHRDENEDYYCYAEPESDEEFERKGRLAVIADGMGGHEGGQIASSLAVERVRDTYLTYPSTDPRQALVAAFQAAHRAIQEYALEHPEFLGMGTTCTCAALKDHQLYFGHVGDSRLYLNREGAIRLLTEDHSFVQRLVRQGLLTPEAAAVHPDRNILTAALGVEGAGEADFSEAPVPLQSGDVLILCTDGLHGLVADDELRAVTAGAPAAEACRELVGLAKDRGGFDNITVQVLRVL
ncbi:MAG TPA: Stp1/IreP family PP2C-type Ser/Thr phosphatase [Bryobacteraceae bacterium]|nr:Stp1/IreP family PP2C-type Ser/Thr phosphatase [Bryobacteraceae bacterium]